ncbi:hypothetical protein GCM10010448_70900 [Streptomyces glomeratus]|uniref:Transposase DDE domain-containing protein n=1 Tax=Streptomyces glomeratus TaxID=284452 RepID=A0ABP6M530_9ACTN
MGRGDGRAGCVGDLPAWLAQHGNRRLRYRGTIANKRHRAVATRYDKLAVRYEATVLVAAINEWL